MMLSEDLRATVALFAQVPDRWRHAHAPYPSALPAVRDLRSCLALIHDGLETLGRRSLDEPVEWRDQSSLQEAWDRFLEGTQDRHRLTVEVLQDSRAQLTSLDDVLASQGASVDGLTRSWLRACLESLLWDVYREVPAHYREDPERIRDASLEWFEAHANQLSDGAQAGCMAALAGSVGPRLEPIATRLYRAPDAGPRLRAQVEEVFTGDLLARIKATPGD